MSIIANWRALSGDQCLSKKERVKWLLFNWILSTYYFINEALFASPFRESYNIKTYPYSQFIDRDTLFETSTRILTDSCLAKILSQISLNQINNLLLFDIGCGSGKYYSFFKQNIGESIEYHGFDRKAPPSVLLDDEGYGDKCFYHNIDDLKLVVDSLDQSKQVLIFSLSVLEHIENPDEFIQMINYSFEKFSNVTQFHCIPSPLAFYTYPVHGYRQFSSTLLSKYNVSPFIPFLLPIGTPLIVVFQSLSISLPRLLGLKSLRDIAPKVYKLVNTSVLQLDSFLGNSLLKFRPLPAFFIFILSKKS